MAVLPALPQFKAAGTSQAGVGALTVPWPASVAIDDIAILVISNKNQALTLGTASGFTQITTNTTTSTGLALYWARAASTSPASPITTAASNGAYARIYTFDHCVRSGNPFNISHAGTAASSTSVSIAAATATVQQVLAVGVVGYNFSSATPQTGAFTDASLASITKRGDESTTGNTGAALVTGTKAAGGTTGALTCTLSNSAPHSCIMIALAPRWTIDAASGVAFPSGTTEWTDFIADNSLLVNGSTAMSVPDGNHKLQEGGTGPFADSTGAFTYTGTNISTNQAMTGFTRQGVAVLDGQVSNAKSTSASLPDLSVNSQANSWAAFIPAYITAIPASADEDASEAAAGTLRLAITSTSHAKLISGANSATGTKDCINGSGLAGGGSCGMLLVLNRTAGTLTLYTSQEIIRCTIGTHSATKSYLLGGDTGIANAAGITNGWDFFLKGAAAEFTDKTAQALLTALNYPLGWNFVEKTANTNAVIQAHQTQTASENAVLQGHQAQTASENAVIQAHQTQTAATSGVVQDHASRTADTNAVLQGHQAQTASTGAVVQAHLAQTADSSAVVQDHAVQTAAATAVIQAHQAQTADAAAVVQAHQIATADANAVVESHEIQSTDTNAVIQGGASGNAQAADTDAAIQGHETQTSASNAIIPAHEAQTADASAVVQAHRAQAASENAVIQGHQAQTAVENAVLQAHSAQAAASSALVQAHGSAPTATNAILQARQESGFIADAVIQAHPIKEQNTNAVLLGHQAQAANTNAIVAELNSQTSITTGVVQAHENQSVVESAVVQDHRADSAATSGAVQGHQVQPATTSAVLAGHELESAITSAVLQGHPIATVAGSAYIMNKGVPGAGTEAAILGHLAQASASQATIEIELQRSANFGAVIVLPPPIPPSLDPDHDTVQFILEPDNIKMALPDPELLLFLMPATQQLTFMSRPATIEFIADTTAHVQFIFIPEPRR